MTTIPPVVPPLPIEQRYARDLAPGAAFGWLRDGWRDLATNPGPSLLYGLFVFLLSAGIVAGLIWLAIVIQHGMMDPATLCHPTYGNGPSVCR